MAWPKSGPNYRPASGIPANGVGKGDGWGGPPRGNAGDRPPKKRTGKNMAKARETIRLDPELQAERREVKANKIERIEQLTEHLCDMALNAPRPETQVSATIAALNRLDGLPVATQKNLNVEMTLEQMVQASFKTRDPIPE